MQRAKSPQLNLPNQTPTHLPPSIRLISATPSASGSTEPNTSITHSNTTPSIPVGGWGEPVPALVTKGSRLALKSAGNEPDSGKKKSRLVPKRSKLFSSHSSSHPLAHQKSRDLSDVVRRVGGGSNSSLNLLSQHDHGKENSLTLARRGYEIYVDTQQDEDDIEVVVMKKVKSRARLGGLFGEDKRQVLGDSTNVRPTGHSLGNGSMRSTLAPTATGSIRGLVNENNVPSEAKVIKEKEGNKWWTIGRGRKDSKDKEKTKDKRSKTPEPLKLGSTRRFFHSGLKSADLPPRSHTPDIASYLNSEAPRSAGIPSRSMTPEPFSTRQESVGRGRAASFDVLRNYSYDTDPKLRAFHAPGPTNAPTWDQNHVPRSMTPSLPNSGIAPPANTMRHYPQEMDMHAPAMPEAPPPTFSSSIPRRSQSPAPSVPLRSASPAPSVALRSATPTPATFLAPPEQTTNHASHSGSIAFRALRGVKSIARIGNSDEHKENHKKEKKTKSKSKKDSIRGAPKSSSSSFEVGAASPLRVKGKEVEKKKSILGLGLGLPASLRIKGSTTPSEIAAHMFNHDVDENAGRRSYDMLKGDQPPVKSDRLSVDSAYLLKTREMMRRSSVSSTSSSSHEVHPKESKPRDSVSSGASSIRPNSIASSARSSGVPAGGIGPGQERRSSNASSSGGGGYSYYDGLKRESYDPNAPPVKRDSLDAFVPTERKTSSGSSIRWDEPRLEREKRKVMDSRRSSAQTPISEDVDGTKKNRHSVEGRKRAAISDIFPAFNAGSESEVGSEEGDAGYPMLTLEEATSDGHGSMGHATPEKKAKKRIRPISDQMLDNKRQGGFFNTPQIVPEGGVLSMLDAATNDLEHLIDILDLEATPGNTPSSQRIGYEYDVGDGSPERCGASLTVQDSLSSLRRGNRRIESSDNTFKAVPRKPSHPSILPKASLEKTLGREISVQSLRPYAQSRKNTLGSGSDSDTKKIALTSSSNANTNADPLVGQQIAPWPTVALSPVKKYSAKKVTSPVFKAPSKHIRGKLSLDGTPAPMADPPPVVQPLKPSMSKQRVLSSVSAKLEQEIPSSPTVNYGTVRASMATFGQRSVSSRGGSTTSIEEATATVPRRVFSKPGHERKKSSPMHLQIKTERSSISITTETKRVLGMTGTMGGSDSSAHRTQVDENDPDSDIPDELQVILSGGSDEETSPIDMRRNGKSIPTFIAPGLPPGQPLPLPTDQLPALPPLPQFPKFHLIDDEENHADLDTSDDSDENHTKKSFDFTGELKKLNESGGSDRRSFVEQLENAFKTPAKVDLRYDYGNGTEDELLCVDVPPVPKIPAEFSNAMHSGMNSLEKGKSVDDPQSLSRIIDTKEPTLLPGSDSLASGEDSHEGPQQSLRSQPSNSSARSRPSEGELDRSFKFGRGSKVAPPQQPVAPDAHNHIRSLSTTSLSIEEDSILRSIYGQAAPVPFERPRASSNDSIHSKRFSQEFSASMSRTNSSGITTNTKSRPSSTISFQGFDSFQEVRRGFEFTSDRPMFYPPPAANNRRRHAREFSIASVSSYGHVVNAGHADPFEYALPSLQERPSSEDMTNMSYSVDDTFSFVRHGSRRRRVDSDSSTFSFRPGAARGHRRQDSNMSVVSQGPPISRYNRSFGHRRNESNTSAGSSSIAHSYAVHGAHAGRAAWARHRPNEPSTDSINSDFSVSRLGRPGLGDKMFDAVAPLTAIAASPTESFSGEQDDFFRMNRTSYDYDSIMDTHRASSIAEDSLFDKTGLRSSGSSESLFGYDDSHPSQPHLIPPNHFRPVSALSVYSESSPMMEDDTMVSMLGGGHVRRTSIGSMMNASPCLRMEKRKHSSIQDASTYQQPQIVAVASTSSFQFGGDRMIRATQGLLQRQSLEESCLIAEGEDLSVPYIAPVFSRESISSRSRSSTCTSSSECPTPPLSASDGSISEASPQSSIDLGHINFALANSTHPMPARPRVRARARAQGQGHRRRFSQARASRSSVYETIEEEYAYRPSPASSKTSKLSSPTIHPPVCVVDPDRRSSLSSNHGSSLWEDDQGVQALRRYYALRDEAQETVTESRKVWLDTPISLGAIQSFRPPKQAQAMQAMLYQSVETYHHLPRELHPRRLRSRTSSRASPYPKEAMHMRHDISPESSGLDSISSFGSLALKELSLNIPISPAPTLDVMKPFSPLVINAENLASPFALPPKDVRPRVGSAARRSALGWSKRSGKSSNGQKENAGHGALLTPGASLRLNRPTPAARRRAAKRA